MGVDAGGTTTRAVAVDAAGTIVGRGAAGGANPNSNGVDAAAANMAAAVGAALGGRPCAGCLIGMAGSSKLYADPTVFARFAAALADVGAAEPPVVVSDAEVAFASGATEADGTVLIAGTGSIAMRIAGHRRAATAGGYGWLLGDEGSAFWLGREAVRAALDGLQREAPSGPFVSAVLAEAGANAFGELITVVNAAPPIALARFAPLVSAHAGDPVAADIIERAALGLAGLATRVRRTGPVVIAGSVAAPDTPVGVRVRELLSHLDVRTAADGVLGAARLAVITAFSGQSAGTSTRGWRNPG
ncbi:N-acetylglucosamine kinase [Actinokineospora sp. UTMC 2448]|uniref:N-acetylglucosamine kinase n=1 Tax=Actinokineospora sp. UTMC 2448 TaxID=2268449 RepID=UPI002164D209|nr:BadF/BadG/BcrA/BcrD ATPase family protein [Actinokineospora sp. UTMC 2448]